MDKNLYEIKPISKDNPYMYNLTFMKSVKKRYTGNLELEPSQTFYGIPKKDVVLAISHFETIKYFEDKEVSLREYLNKFRQIYNENC